MPDWTGEERRSGPPAWAEDLLKQRRNGGGRLLSLAPLIIAASVVVGSWVDVKSEIAVVKSTLDSIKTQLSMFVPRAELEGRFKAIEREMSRETRSGSTPAERWGGP